MDNELNNENTADITTRRNEAMSKFESSEVGQLARKHGYDIEHTGGGCTALVKRLEDGRSLWISAGCESPEIVEMCVECYIHHEDGTGYSSAHTASNVKQAIDWLETTHQLKCYLVEWREWGTKEWKHYPVYYVADAHHAAMVFGYYFCNHGFGFDVTAPQFDIRDIEIEIGPSKPFSEVSK